MALQRNELFDPAEVLTIWETNGRLDAWVLVSPRHAGYAAERAFVAEASNGAFAAFTVTWHDHPNRTGLCEPVGTHSGCRRRGLGKALLLFATRAMAAGGMEYAATVNEGSNDASRALYGSVGFTPWYLLDGYTTPILARALYRRKPLPVEPPAPMTTPVAGIRCMRIGADTAGGASHGRQDRRPRRARHRELRRPGTRTSR